MGRCSHCGEEYVNGASFCTNCGAKIEVIEENNYVFCTNCGKKIIDESTSFCPSCGTKIKRGNSVHEYYQRTNSSNVSNESNIGSRFDRYREETKTKEESNNDLFAILGFIFSLVFAPVGLILSIIGLKSKGLKVLSIIGIIISVISILFTIFFFGIFMYYL